MRLSQDTAGRPFRRTFVRCFFVFFSSVYGRSVGLARSWLSVPPSIRIPCRFHALTSSRILYSGVFWSRWRLAKCWTTTSSVRSAYWEGSFGVNQQSFQTGLLYAFLVNDWKMSSPLNPNSLMPAVRSDSVRDVEAKDHFHGILL